MPEKLYMVSEASFLLAVHPRTIQKWDKAGKIKVVRTVGGRRRIPESEILRIQGLQGIKIIVGYARVSSASQKDDLDRQINYLQQQTQIAEIITDIGSGLNDKRKGYQKLLYRVQQKEIQKIVIVYADRLTRFGFETILQFCKSYGCEIEILQQKEYKTPQEELVNDLLTLIAHFSGKLYGLRSHKYKEVLKDAKNIFTAT